MTDEDRMDDDRDRATRRKMLAALEAHGVTPDVIAEEYHNLITGESSDKVKRLALKDLTELMGASPKKRTSINVQSDQRVLRLTVGEGSVGNLSADDLRKLSAEERRQYIALQRKARLAGGDTQRLLEAEAVDAPDAE